MPNEETTGSSRSPQLLQAQPPPLPSPNRSFLQTNPYNMKSFFLASALLGVTATAVPIDHAQPRGFDRMAAASHSELVERTSFSTTRNELGECAPITVIFARGTVEPGNVGDLAGPPFFNALDILYGDSNVAVQGVDYPATIAGYLGGGDAGGAATLAALTDQAASQCPDTQIILSGYSQGAQVVHLGVEQISAQVASRVKAVVSNLTYLLFGQSSDRS